MDQPAGRWLAAEPRQGRSCASGWGRTNPPDRRGGGQGGPQSAGRTPDARAPTGHVSVMQVPLSAHPAERLAGSPPSTTGRAPSSSGPTTPDGTSRFALERPPAVRASPPMAVPLGLTRWLRRSRTSAGRGGCENVGNPPEPNPSPAHPHARQHVLRRSCRGRSRPPDARWPHDGSPHERPTTRPSPPTKTARHPQPPARGAGPRSATSSTRARGGVDEKSALPDLVDHTMAMRQSNCTLGAFCES